MFKNYIQNQLTLIPQDYREYLGENHEAILIDTLMEELNFKPLYDSYANKNMGTSAYNPKMMTKVIVYAASKKIYSSREIEKLITSDLGFMYLAGNNKPNFRTICNFRKDKGVILEEILIDTLRIAKEVEFEFDFETVSLDGTKFYANASKRKNVEIKDIEEIRKEARMILRKMDEIDEYEDETYGTENNPKIKKITSEEFRKKVIKSKEKIAKEKELLKKKIEEENEEKKEEMKKERIENEKEKFENSTEENKKKLKEYEKDLKTLEKYEEYEDLKLEERIEEKNKIIREENKKGKTKRKMISRINTTDEDSSLMKMKKQDFANGYNVQLATNNQLILGTHISNAGDDSNELIPTIEKLINTINKYFTGEKIINILADKGYGNEKNYDFLKKKEIKSHIPHSENRLKERDNLIENKENDTYIDKNTGEIYSYYKFRDRIEGMGEIPKGATKEEKEKYYRSKCYRSKGDDGKEKTITINKNLVKLYKENDKRLYTEEGQKLYKQRGCDVEPTFGNIKENLGFTRFHLRGMKGVKAELMIQCLTHNIKKLMLFRAS